MSVVIHVMAVEPAKGAKPTICSHCNGAGQIRMQQGFFSMQQTCNYCRGKGQIIKDVCNVCNGSSSIEQEKTLSVNIPAGVDSGDRVRLSGRAIGPKCSTWGSFCCC